MRFFLPALAILAVTCAPVRVHGEDDAWLGRDKALHFGASAVIAGSGYALGVALFDGRLAPAILGGSLALAAGAAKEGRDALGYGNASWRDFTWDAIGTAFGVGVALGIDLLVRPSKRQASQATYALWVF